MKLPFVPETVDAVPPTLWLRIDLMFFVSVSLARPRLDEACPLAHRRSAPLIHSSMPTGCPYARLFCSVCGSASSWFSRRSQRKSSRKIERCHGILFKQINPRVRG